MVPETVIVVGREIAAALPELLPSLESLGHRVIAAPEVEALLPVLEGNPEAILLVYDAESRGTAHRVLQAVTSYGRKVPVVVVTPNGNSDEYYELMSEGAYDYFDLRDGVEAIERSLRWAAQAA